jgi:hypothetical protein
VHCNVKQVPITKNQLKDIKFQNKTPLFSFDENNCVFRLRSEGVKIFNLK